MVELTPKQQRFVDEYLKDPNATAAAKRAGYSKKTAGFIGSENLKKPYIAAAIAKVQTERSLRTKIDADWVLERLVRLTETNIADFLVVPDGGGMPHFDLSDATPEQLAAIEALQLDTHREKGEDGGVIEKIKITLPGKLKTLKLIGKHVDVQAFAERKEIGGIGGGPLKVEDVSPMKAALLILAALREAKENQE